MEKVKNIVTKLKKIPKIKYISVLLLIVLAITVTFPTLARYKNRLDLETILKNNQAWDGTVATGYHKGSGEIDDPYIISTPNELAFFQVKLQTENYAGKYFKLSNDIIINSGTFSYENNKVKYTVDTTEMYLKEYTTELYQTTDESQTTINSINSFSSLDNFAGHFDGDSYRIYGLYMTSSSLENLGLFSNLSGTVENLYLENTMIYGGSATAALASTSTNASINNIFVKGNVINTKSNTDNKTVYLIDNKSYTKDINTLTDTITLPTLNYKEIKSIHFTGTYQTTEPTQKIKINGSEINQGDFDFELTDPEELITVEVADELSSEITLTNMKYEITYTSGIAAGIIAKAENTTVRNSINKANVISTDEAAGLLGNTTNTTIKRSYNTGNITATTKASGLVSSIKNSTSEIVIDRTYNKGNLTATETSSFVGYISNNTSVVMTRTFNVAQATNNLVTEQPITIELVQDVNASSILGINTLAIEQISSKDNLLALGFDEYVDKVTLDENSTKLWVYEENYLPTLYIDDLNDPIAVLNVGTYNWEGIGYELKDTYFSKTTAFKISPKDENETITSYYYIHKEKRALTKAEIDTLEWTEYKDIVPLNEEGYYVIYVKAIDSDNNVKYINSEQLIIDLTAPTATITMNENTWNNFTEDLNNINISDITSIQVETTDTYSNVTETLYYVSNIFLTKQELKDLDQSKWSNYEDVVTLNEKGTYIVNIKTTDERGHTEFYNTDYIVFGGFEETLNLGREEAFYDKLNITSTSTVTYNFTYSDQTSYKEGYTNHLITNTNLPINTKITLINNNTNDIYTYKVTSSTKDIKLNKFTKLSQSDNTKVFNDKNFINETTKNISLVFDFKNTEITDILSIEPYIEIKDSSNKTILSTLKTTLKETVIYPNNEMELVINTSDEIPTINYNSDSKTTISLETNTLYKTNNEETIYDSNLLNKKLGLTIKLVDSNDEIVAKKYLKNITFKVEDKFYSPDNDGIVRINLSNNVEKITKDLEITTYLTTTELETGSYKFVIEPIISSDGKYSNQKVNDQVIIPVTTIKPEKVDYGFNVVLDSNDKVIYKKQETTIMNITVNELSTFNNSNVRVSLYRKKVLGAEDQTYELVDLQNYLTNKLTKAEDKVYYVTTNDLALSLNNTKFDNTGYELKFELYDGDKFITAIKKKFIVR